MKQKRTAKQCLNMVQVKKGECLLYYFAFLPAQVFAFAFAAFQRGFRVACAAVSADFHVKAMLLSNGFLYGV
jgi:hypothetical protein